MDSEGSHRTTRTSSTTSELFICFTSRLSSSSSMKISGKSILSPGRARDQPISLPTSLSRRLRTNGSIKGGQASPMFPTGGKKRGCAFENPEPSSPKVTCIGQVRVKTKKKARQTRSLSRRRSGEVSFRKVEQSRDVPSQNEDQMCTQRYQQANASTQYQQQQPECSPHRNQRWVHLPLTICEALRAFGAEFSCLFPCRSSSCFSTSERDKDEKVVGSSEDNGQSSCGAVFARWLVALQDGEGGKGREIELVVAGDEERTEVRERTLRSSRRHVFDDLEIKDEKCEVKNEVAEEEARVSICIPPKNALLLMRCRSDPTRLAALANRLWETPACLNDEDVNEDDKEDSENYRDEEERVDEGQCEVNSEVKMEDKEVPQEMVVPVEVNEEKQDPEAETELVVEVKEEKQVEKLQINEDLQEAEHEKQDEEKKSEVDNTVEEENEMSDSLSEAHVDQESEQNDENEPIQVKDEESITSIPSSVQLEEEEEGEPEKEETLAEEVPLEEEEADKSTVEKETRDKPLEEDEEETVTQERSEPEYDIFESHTEEEEQEVTESEVVERESEESDEPEKLEDRERSKSSVLPDCLLLMMCEPKLSMEVSKETWVCSTDFIRCLPERPQAKPTDPDEFKKRVSTDSNLSIPTHQPQYNQPVQQPPRSSCSFPVGALTGVSMATMIEQKLVNASAYEPFVLTRCKSEPMRTAAGKLAPDACFWKNRKLELHRRATFGVGF